MASLVEIKEADTYCLQQGAVAQILDFLLPDADEAAKGSGLIRALCISLCDGSSRGERGEAMPAGPLRSDIAA